MRADASWDLEGLIAGIRKNIESGTAMTLDTFIRIPFSSIGAAAPRDGESWRGNFFRIDRHPAEGDEYSAWRPTMKQPADFHVTGAFGRLVFRDL
jgi:hypothetical protein